MPTPLRRRMRIARRGFGYTVAIVLIFVALLLGAASQMLPLAERHPERIAAWLSERAGRPVAFDRVKTQWTRRGPLLMLDGLRIGEGDTAFMIGDTEMLVSLYAGLLPGHAFSELRLRGLDLTLERASDGRWQVRGLPGQQQTAGGDPLAALEGLGELQVIGGKLAVVAPELGVDAQIPKVHLRLRVDGDRVRAGLRAWPRPDAVPLNAALDLDRKRGDGRVYAGARKADLAAWTSLLRLQGIVIEGGKGRAQAWAQLHDHRVAEVTVAAAVDNLILRGTAIESGAAPPRSRFDHVDALARWRLARGGWHAYAPRLRIGHDNTTQVLDGLRMAGGEHFAMKAARIDAGPLFATLALSDRLSPDLRRWLQTARPHASLRDVEIAGRHGGAVRASAQVAGLGFDAVGKAPGLRGLGGTMTADEDGFVLRFDPDAPVRFDWPTGFGVMHTVKLRGEVGGWREGTGWRVGTTALRIDGQDLGVAARGGMRWQGDGTRPWIDIAAEIDDTVLPVAKGFWLRQNMPAAAVNWLDTALVAGRLHGGRAVISGDLDDWPFRDNSGLFEATGRIVDATLLFQDGWPAAQDVDADASFTGTGFTVEGTGRLGAVNIRQLRAGIDDYAGGTLTVNANGTGDAAHLLAVLRQSPLRKEHAETFANVTASGAADVGFGLRLSLRQGSTVAIDGTVVLDNARLADRRWQLAFDRVHGKARYSRGGFEAQDLAVRYEGESAKLSLRAGRDFVHDARDVFEADLEAYLSAAGLLDRAKDLAWLKPYLSGRSRWSVGVAVAAPANGATASARLRLASDLIGTALALPAPLRKPASASLAARIETPLPLGAGDVEVGLGDVMALRARSSNGQTGVRVALGSASVDVPAPASGLIATGRADALDAIDWLALTRTGEGGGKLPLQRIDVTARDLQLLGGHFPDTRVIAAPAGRGAVAVQADGQALHGALLVPASDGEAIAGRFQRVQWRTADTQPDAAATPADTVVPGVAGNASTANAIATAAIARDGAEIDPAKIPALSIDIDELRLNDAQLGSAKVRTRPTASGMHIEQIASRAPLQRIDLSGDWNGTGIAARTRLKVEMGSGDFGALLAGLGLGEQLAGGEGTVKFDAQWPGNPVAFKLEDLDGSLQMEAREGRLLEIEPGAGRVLGLLSLAQLPRRLTLDFRDFFYKGFAFNKLGGTIRFAGGFARSDALVIEGPAATIGIRGAADLRAQSYDQTVEVRPKTGNLLTAIGAVAGGPMGAALGAAANAVLNKPLGSIAARTYRVTGPWKNPKVQVISREQSRAAAADTPPAG